MGNEEIDNETLSKIGHHIINQDFDKITLEDIKKIEAKIRYKRDIPSILTANIEPVLVILTIFEILISIFLLGDSQTKNIIFFGLLSFLNIFIIGFLLFSIHEYSNYRKEHTIFSIVSPTIIMVTGFIFRESQSFLNIDFLLKLIILILFYFMYNVFVFIFFNVASDKLISNLFSRLNNITFNQGNTITFKLEDSLNTDLIYNYIYLMIFRVFNLRFFASQKSEKYKSIIFLSYDIETDEPPMYDKLVKYYLFVHIDTLNSTVSFAYFKKYFDKLLIDDIAIKEKELLDYYLTNICKDLKQIILDNLDDMNKNFQAFDDELFGKRHRAKLGKIKWFFDRKVLITLFIAIVLIAMYSYSWFSSIASWVTSHETLASGIIGAVVVIFAQFILRQKPH